MERDKNWQKQKGMQTETGGNQVKGRENKGRPWEMGKEGLPLWGSGNITVWDGPIFCPISPPSLFIVAIAQRCLASKAY